MLPHIQELNTNTVHTKSMAFHDVPHEARK